MSTITFTGGISTTLSAGSTNFYNMVVNKTGGSAVTLGGNLDVNGNFTIQSGTLTAVGTQQINVAGNWDNTNGWFNAAQSTVTFDGSSGTQILITGGTSVGKQFFNFNFTGASTVTTSGYDLYVSSNLTFSSSAKTFDNASSSRNVTVNGNVLMINNRTDMGVSTWTVGGNWWTSGIGTLNSGTYAGWLIMNGTGKTMTTDVTYGNQLSNVEILGDIALQTAIELGGYLIISGTLTASIGIGDAAEPADMQLVGTGLLLGAGGVQTEQITRFDSGAGIYASLTLYPFGSMAGGHYASPNVQFLNGTGNNYTRTILGPVIFDGDLQINNSDVGSFTIDNSANNPTFVLHGSLTLYDAPASAPIIWTKGSGTITFSSTSAETASFTGKSVEPIISSNTAAGGLTFISSFSAAGLTLNASALGSSATMYFSASASTFTISTFTIVGDASHYVVLKSTASARWHLNDVNMNTASYVYVSSCDAGAGKTIFCSNCIDGGNNINWVFMTGLRSPILGGVVRRKLERRQQLVAGKRRSRRLRSAELDDDGGVRRRRKQKWQREH